MYGARWTAHFQQEWAGFSETPAVPVICRFSHCRRPAAALLVMFSARLKVRILDGVWLLCPTLLETCLCTVMALTHASRGAANFLGSQQPKHCGWFQQLDLQPMHASNRSQRQSQPQQYAQHTCCKWKSTTGQASTSCPIMQLANQHFAFQQ